MAKSKLLQVDAKFSPVFPLGPADLSSLLYASWNIVYSEGQTPMGLLAPVYKVGLGSGAGVAQILS